MAHWIENKHPQYEETARRATYAADHYTGEARDKAERDAGTRFNLRPTSRIDRDADLSAIAQLQGEPGTDGKSSLGTYLIQKQQGEHDDAFAERAAISRFPRYFHRVVQSFVGRIDMVSGRDVRLWDSPALGNPNDAAKPMGRLWEDADGEGTNWISSLADRAAELCVLPRVAYYVEPPTTNAEGSTDYPDGRVVIFKTEDVINWGPDRGPLRWIVVREGSPGRENPQDEDPEKIRRFLLIDTEGFQRFTVQDGSVEEGERVAWSQPFYATPERERVRLPVGFAVLDPSIGYQTARGNNYLYNMLSDIRNNIRQVTHNKLAGDVTDEQFERTIKALRDGWNLLQGPWQYIGPDPGYTSATWQVYKDEVRDFFVTSFQEYESRARERTATEIEAAESAGRYSFLASLVRALDEMENDWLFLLSQIHAPNSPQTWRASRVTRTRHFQPIDPYAEADKIMAALFGETAPPVLPPTTYADGLTRALENLGLEADEGAMQVIGPVVAALMLQRANPNMGAAQALAILGGETARLGQTDFVTNGVEQ